jgi:hypothetical protein
MAPTLLIGEKTRQCRAHFESLVETGSDLQRRQADIRGLSSPKTANDKLRLWNRQRRLVLLSRYRYRRLTVECGESSVSSKPCFRFAQTGLPCGASSFVPTGLDPFRSRTDLRSHSILRSLVSFSHLYCGRLNSTRCQICRRRLFPWRLGQGNQRIPAS